MPSSDGSIVIEANVNVSKAEQQLAKLKEDIDKLEKDIAAQKNKKGPLEEQLEKASREAAIAEENVERLKNRLAEIQAITSGQIVVPYSDFESAYANESAITKELAEQERILKEKSAEANKLADADERENKALEKQIELLEKLKNKAGGLEAGLAKAREETSRMPEATKQADSAMDKFANRIKGLMRRVFVFSLITSALRSLRTWLGNVIKTNAEAQSAIARLKGALLTLAQPLVEIIIPAFTVFVNLLAAIVSRIAEFIAMIFGTTIDKSSKAAKGLYGQKKALEGVSEAAEEATGSLAGFDEINTITTETAADARSGGSTPAGIVPDFGFADGISDKLKKIADLVLLIAAGIALWSIGNKINGPLGNLLKILGGILIAVGGIVLFAKGFKDAWENGINWENLITMVAGLGIAIAGLWMAFGPVAAGIAAVVGGIALLVVGFKDAMENGWNLQNTLTSIAGIVATGLGLTLITGSIIPAIIAGIAAILLALTIATGHGEELIAGIRSVIEGFKDFFVGIFTGDIEKAIGGIGKIFSGLGTAVGAVIDSIRYIFLNFLTWLDEKTGGKLHDIIEVIKLKFADVASTVKNIFNGLFSAIQQVLTGIIQFLSGVFTGDVDKIAYGLSNILFGALNAGITVIEGFINLIIDGINSLTRLINTIHVNIPDWLGGGTLGFNIPTIGKLSLPRIPALAQGAVIPPNREFAAILGDQTHGNNIEAPENLIRQIVREESGGMNAEMLAVLRQILAATNAKQKMYVNGRVLAETAKDGINDMTRQAGKPVLVF